MYLQFKFIIKLISIVFRWKMPWKAVTAEGLPSLNTLNNNNNNKNNNYNNDYDNINNTSHPILFLFVSNR